MWKSLENKGNYKGVRFVKNKNLFRNVEFFKEKLDNYGKVDFFLFGNN